MDSYRKPYISIILPCRNEVGFIEECITSIFAQDLPEGGFEIIVADGMSTDGTREYLDRMGQQHPELRVLNNLGRIVSTGLNAAIKGARGDIIVRMDAHTTYAFDYVRECLAVMKETGADNVGGPVLTRADTFIEQAIRAVFHCRWAVGGARSHRPEYEGFVDTVIAAGKRRYLKRLVCLTKTWFAIKTMNIIFVSPSRAARFFNLLASAVGTGSVAP
jgi:succinoglycan biosynthesis protein ExoA